MESDRVALKTLGVATAGAIGIEIMFSLVIGQGWLASLTGTAGARLLDIGWMAFLLSRCARGWTQVGLVRESWEAGLRKGVMWSAGFGALTIMGWSLLYVLGIDPLRPLQRSSGGHREQLALLFLVGGVIGPVAEEIYFRGLIYGYCRRLGLWPAVVVSTLAFTLLHSQSSAASIPLIVGGLLFAAAYEIEKNLLVPITLHVLGNVALFSLLYF